jgi:hypothetical protein
MQKKMKKTRLLLTSVIGPYGIKDRYAEGLGMQMEGINNQITREQDVHSPRMINWSYGLYFLAENVSVPSVVLDFPTWMVFVNELKKGYSHVGISFITPNVYKAKRMADYIRRNYPDTKIILGGCGTSVPDLDRIVPYDEVCDGEGISWLRRYFGEDIKQPIKHPILSMTSREIYYGFRKKPNAAVIVPGLGCTNGCDFCMTSHRYNKKFIPFLKSGRDIFKVCEQAKKELGCDIFGIEDDNFLKEEKSAKELLIEMEKRLKPFTFLMFSSMEILSKLGADFLVRLGTSVVFIGIESKQCKYPKNKGIDIPRFVQEFQSKGISVVGAGILFQDHHNRKNMKEDIDWLIGLKTDMLQLFALSPLANTPLYARMQSEGRLVGHKDYKKQNGISSIWFKHPHFRSSEPERILRNAARRYYEVNGPSMLSLALTLAQGYKRLKKDMIYREKNSMRWNQKTLRYEKSDNPEPDRFIRLRLKKMRMAAVEFRPALLAIKVFCPNKKARKKCDKVIKLYNELFGRPSLADRLSSLVLLGFASVEAAKIWIYKKRGLGIPIYQPNLNRIEYNM